MFCLRGRKRTQCDRHIVEADTLQRQLFQGELKAEKGDQENHGSQMWKGEFSYRITGAWGHRRSQDFYLGGGIRPTPPSLTSVVHTFEAVAGRSSRVIGGGPERNKIELFFILLYQKKNTAPSLPCPSSLSVIPIPFSCGLEMLMFSSCNPKLFAIRHITIQWTHPVTISTLIQ